MSGTIFAYDLKWLSEYAHYIVGCSVAVLVLLVMMSRWRMHVQTRKPHQSILAHDEWTTPDPSFGNRRTSLRREGSPVEIYVSCSAFQNTTQQAWVVDRSMGGLRLTMDQGISPGNTVRIMAVNAPKKTEWVTLLVRSCKPIDDYFELGCEFDQTPPWNVLLLFG